nr:MAG TPA: hypothetical protein [Caudoviricetes sp.]
MLNIRDFLYVILSYIRYFLYLQHQTINNKQRKRKNGKPPNKSDN